MSLMTSIPSEQTNFGKTPPSRDCCEDSYEDEVLLSKQRQRYLASTTTCEEDRDGSQYHEQ